MIVPALMFDHQRHWMRHGAGTASQGVTGLSESLLNLAP
jgi:hypothetical protein